MWTTFRNFMEMVNGIPVNVIQISLFSSTAVMHKHMGELQYGRIDRLVARIFLAAEKNDTKDQRWLSVKCQQAVRMRKPVETTQYIPGPFPKTSSESQSSAKEHYLSFVETVYFIIKLPLRGLPVQPPLSGNESTVFCGERRKGILSALTQKGFSLPTESVQHLNQTRSNHGIKEARFSSRVRGKIRDSNDPSPSIHCR